MNWLQEFARRLRMLVHRKQFDAELEEEMRLHLELREEEQIESGQSSDDARAAARRRFGNATYLREESHIAWGWNWLEHLAQDIRHGLRTLRRSPGFTLFAVLTAAFGIGATTAVFGVLDAVVLRPLPYPHPEQLVTVNISPLAVDPSAHNMAPEDYFLFREQSRTFEDVGIYVDGSVNVTGLAEPERVHAVNVTHDVLSVLGMAPMFGRAFSESDDAPGAPPSAILTYGYWQSKFGGDPCVGKTIIVDGTARRIIGVLPQNFHFLDMRDLALLLPIQLDRNKTLMGNFSYYGIARLKGGTTIAEADADVTGMLPIVLRSFLTEPGFGIEIFENARLAARIRPLKQEIVGNIGTLLWVVMGGIGMVLIIACANVANLLLVRTETRQQELAVRVALGASRGRIAVGLLTESAIIGLLGAILGLGLAWAGLRSLVALAPSGLPRVSEIGVNLQLVLFSLAVALAAGLLFGMIPITKYASACGGLLDGERTLGLSRERHRVRNILVMVQVALAFVLLICSGLMIRTFRALIRVNPGFVGPAELQTFRISIPSSDVSDEMRVPRLQQEIQDKLAAIPGISSVGFSNVLPLDGSSGLDNVFAEDRTYARRQNPPFRHLVFISPGFLRTMGIPLIAGRDINWTDTYNELPVALISENFAHEYWGTPAKALGKRIRISSIDDWREIVGVVADVRDEGMDKPARSDVYWPTLMKNFEGKPLRVQRYVAFVVRSPLAGSETLRNQIRQAVWSVDANLPIATVYTMNDLYVKSMARRSFTLVMLGIAGAMALFLGATGLYGAIAYSASQRTREIGIRMALGAQARNVTGLILGEGMLVILIGLAIGLAGSLAATRFMSSLLFGVSATDPMTFAGVAAFLTIVALAACFVPARRATRVEPIIALRHE